MNNPENLNKAILLYDGECSFCNGAVQWIIARDPRQHVYFASQQGELGQALKAKYKISDELDSLVLIDEGKAYIYSSAVIRVSKYLHSAWPMLQIFALIPPFVRNSLYRYVAKHRYRWFGQQQACLLPTPEIRARYLD